jgi:hypothetical protein
MSFFGDLWDSIIDIPGGIVDQLGSLVIGPAGAIGITAIQEAILVGTPDIIIQGIAVVAGPVGRGLLPVRTRKMSSEERTVARMVYGSSLPSFDDIILTNVKGINGRWFVVPNVAGEILVNIGESFGDPLHYTNAAYPEFGQVLMHELGHAWQIHHLGSVDYVIEAVPPQVKGAEYDPGNGSKLWSEYSIEQQATIVDRWYAGYSAHEPCSRGNPYYNHIRYAINGGNEPPVLQTLSVRDVAKSKFGETGGFSVSSVFPRQNSGSLRRRLIGLKS